MNTFCVGDRVTVTDFPASQVGIVVKLKRNKVGINYIVKWPDNTAGWYSTWDLKLLDRLTTEQLLTHSDRDIRAAGVRKLKSNAYSKVLQACG